jgi:CheY-like chemotaxis protein
MSNRSRTTSRRERGAGDAFLAALSHELRTPLNGVLGMAGLLARTPLNADQLAYVAAIQESGEHLLGLVNDVLDLAKLEAGGFTLHPAPTDVEQLLRSTAELLSPRAHAKGLEIAWAADAGVPFVMADEGRLRQILFNLAGNAVKFTETGGVLLTASLAGAGPQGVRLRFSVKDTGPGVQEADRERIFQPFMQGPAVPDAQIESTGLGLAVVRKLAEAFGGVVTLDSRPGEGAVFAFEASFPPAEAPGLEWPLKGLQVGVLTSNPVVAEAARLQIQASGGRAALLQPGEPLDGLPAGAPLLIDLDGPKAPKPAAGHPCIVLVKAEARGRIPALRRAGYRGYLIKPLRRKSLAERVLLAAEPPEAQHPPRVRADERIRRSAAVGARVLLAEDNAINAMLGRALLEREGCTVDRVQTGPQALEAATTQGYDLILLDLRMPGMDGLQVARAVREAGVRTPIAALTADAFEDTRRMCLDAGMDDFLTKPLDSSALRAVLARHTSAGFTQTPPRAKLAS